MATVKDVVDKRARDATGVGLGLAAADEWLAAKLADAVLVKRALLAESRDEYSEFMKVMSKDECMWVQVGSNDREDNSLEVEEGAWGDALRLACFPEGCIMSDVEEAPASKVMAPVGDGLVAKLHGIEGMVVVTGALIWYYLVTTTRTADTSIPMSRVLPHNH